MPNMDDNVNNSVEPPRRNANVDRAISGTAPGQDRSPVRCSESVPHTGSRIPTAAPLLPPERGSCIGATAAANQSASAVLDGNALMARIGGNVTLLQKLTQLYSETGRKYLHSIEAAAGCQDAAALAATAHALKGAASNLGGARAAETAGRLESAGNKNNFDNLNELLPQMRTDVLALESELCSLLKTLESRV